MQGVDIDRPKLQSHSPLVLDRAFLPFLSTGRVFFWQVAICAWIVDVGVDSRGTLGSTKWVLTSDPQAFSDLLRDIGILN
jgi:hypothetical protein